MTHFSSYSYHEHKHVLVYRYDSLSIRNENNKPFGRYCGVRSGQTVIVTGHYVKISFHSDDSVSRKGYNLSFSAIADIPVSGKYGGHEIIFYDSPSKILLLLM